VVPRIGIRQNARGPIVSIEQPAPGVKKMVELQERASQDFERRLTKPASESAYTFGPATSDTAFIQAPIPQTKLAAKVCQQTRHEDQLARRAKLLSTDNVRFQ
jgi:hypothetical protein